MGSARRPVGRDAGSGAEARHVLLELLTGEAFVGQDGVALKADSVEHLLRDFALGRVGGGELEADGHAVRGAEQVEPNPQK